MHSVVTGPLRRVWRETRRIGHQVGNLFGRAMQRRSRRFRVLEWEGLTVLVDRRSYVDKHVYNGRTWEARQRRRLADAIARVEDLRTCTFLDVGAYWAMYGMMACRLGVPDVHVFEPDLRNRHQLSAQLFLNGMERAIRVHSCAASDRDGLVPFLPSEGFERNRGKARIGESPGSEGAMVECRRLDGLLALRGRTIIAKIDVEGREFEVLAGMAELVARNAILLQVEVFPQNIERVRDRARSHGLRFVERIDDDDFYVNAAAEPLIAG